MNEAQCHCGSLIVIGLLILLAVVINSMVLWKFATAFYAQSNFQKDEDE